jgi:hypothetical protein
MYRVEQNYTLEHLVDTTINVELPTVFHQSYSDATLVTGKCIPCRYVPP